MSHYTTSFVYIFLEMYKINNFVDSSKAHLIARNYVDMIILTIFVLYR